MKKLILICIAAIFFASCERPSTRHPEPKGDEVQVQSVNTNQTSLDSVTGFLLAASARDFHDHGPTPDSLRGVKLGYQMTDQGQRLYFICGEFAAGNRNKWTAFATIKTSGYEQWIGTQAKTLLRDSRVKWEGSSDLSSSLQRQVDSLKAKK